MIKQYSFLSHHTLYPQLSWYPCFLKDPWGLLNLLTLLYLLGYFQQLQGAWDQKKNHGVSSFFSPAGGDTQSAWRKLCQEFIGAKFTNIISFLFIACCYNFYRPSLLLLIIPLQHDQPVPYMTILQWLQHYYHILNSLGAKKETTNFLFYHSSQLWLPSRGYFLYYYLKKTLETWAKTTQEITKNKAARFPLDGGLSSDVQGVWAKADTQLCQRSAAAY